MPPSPMSDRHRNLTDFLFVDIATVPQFPCLLDAPEQYQQLWQRKAEGLRRSPDDPVADYGRAALYAEFGKIVAVAAGYFWQDGGDTLLRISAFAGEEKRVLSALLVAMSKYGHKNPGYRICTYNGREFDCPFMARRLIIHSMPLPEVLDVAGARPWEIHQLDVMDLWRFGDRREYTPLDLLAYTLGVKLPESKLDGSQIAEAYYTRGELWDIARYCQHNALATAQVLRRYRNLAPLPPGQIGLVDPKIYEAK